MRGMKKRSLTVLLVGVSPTLGGCVVASGSSRGGGGGSFFFFLLPMLLVFFMFRMARRRVSGLSQRGAAARPVRMEQTSGDTTMIRAELSVLADDVLRLETDVALHEAARSDYESAVHRYRVVQAAVEQHSAGAQVDLSRVQRVLDEALWSMSRAKAITQGYPPPPPPATLQHPGTQGEPAVRVADDDRPMYVGAPMSFRSGWFGGGGGLLGGLMLGSVLGGFGGWTMSEIDDGGDWTDGDVGGA